MALSCAAGVVTPVVAPSHRCSLAWDVAPKYSGEGVNISGVCIEVGHFSTVSSLCSSRSFIGGFEPIKLPPKYVHELDTEIRNILQLRMFGFYTRACSNHWWRPIDWCALPCLVIHVSLFVMTFDRLSGGRGRTGILYGTGETADCPLPQWPTEGQVRFIQSSIHPCIHSLIYPLCRSFTN